MWDKGLFFYTPNTAVGSGPSITHPNKLYGLRPKMEVKYHEKEHY